VPPDIYIIVQQKRHPIIFEYLSET